MDRCDDIYYNKHVDINNDVYGLMHSDECMIGSEIFNVLGLHNSRLLRQQA